MCGPSSVSVHSRWCLKCRRASRRSQDRTSASATVRISVSAAHAKDRFTTRLTLAGLRLGSLEIGHTLPANSAVKQVLLNGREVSHFSSRLTNRGLEITVPAHGGGPFTLTVIG